MNETEAADELTYRDVADILRRSWKAIAISVVLGIAIAIGLVKIWTPVYRAQVLLAPVSSEPAYEGSLSRLVGQFAPISGALGISGGEASTSRSARFAILSSRRLTDEFITQHDLMPVLFPKRWDAQAKAWKGPPPTLDQANYVFGKDIRSVQEDRRTNLVTLSIEFTDRKLAAEWANELAARANNYLRTHAIDEAKRSITFLEGEFRRTSVVERQQIILRLIESKTGEIMMANSRPEYAFAVIDPAVVPDADNFVEPRKVAVVFFGALLGLILGVVIATVRWMRAPRAAATA